MRPSPPFGVGVLVSLAACFSMVGCSGGGDNLPRERISGTVTLDGAPLGKGNIMLMPADPAAGPDVGAVIADGAFEVPRDQGPVPGTYKVRISSTEETAARPAKAGTRPPQPGDGDAPVVRERIPARYNAQTTLEAEVTRGGANAFEFPLTSK